MAQDTLFGRFAKKVAAITGSPGAFLTALLLVVVWGISGPIFQYSETWQLVINTGTTIITFLMVFIIQHTQNKDTMAMQTKLDELIRANPHAHNALLCLEEMKEDEIESIRDKYLQLADEALEHLREGTQDDQKPQAVEDFGIAAAGKKKPAKSKKKPTRKKA